MTNPLDDLLENLRQSIQETPKRKIAGRREYIEDVNQIEWCNAENENRRNERVKGTEYEGLSPVEEWGLRQYKKRKAQEEQAKGQDQVPTD